MDRLNRIWKQIQCWRHWKLLLYPHPLLITALSVTSAVGLVWVFGTGRDFTAPAYLLYVISAYSLTVLCLLLWKKLPWLLYHFRRDPFAQTILKDNGAFGVSMYVEQCINFCYGALKILTGIFIGSAWIGADGIYNFVQGCIQLYQILRHKTVTDLTKQWKAYRVSGYLMILTHLTMTGMMFQMIQMGRHEISSEISMIATAAFAFYKLTTACIDVAKDRKHRNPVDSSVIFLNLSQALYNLFVLQVGLLWVFGGAQYPYRKLMNTLTGMAVCLLVLGMGIYMIRRSNRNLQEKSTA